jgi:hypothetical protein
MMISVHDMVKAAEKDEVSLVYSVYRIEMSCLVTCV